MTGSWDPKAHWCRRATGPQTVSKEVQAGYGKKPSEHRRHCMLLRVGECQVRAVRVWTLTTKGMGASTLDQGVMGASGRGWFFFCLPSCGQLGAGAPFTREGNDSNMGGRQSVIGTARHWATARENGGIVCIPHTDYKNNIKDFKSMETQTSQLTGIRGSDADARTQ